MHVVGRAASLTPICPNLAGPTGEVLREDNLTCLYRHPIRRLEDGSRRVFLAD